MRWRYLAFLAFVRCLTPSKRPHHSITWTTADGSRVIDGVQRGELLRTALLRRGFSPHNNNSQLINCRGLGTCGTCAVEVRGGVEPAEASARERLRLSFPPHRGVELRPNLRLACQCTVDGDVVVSKFEGFWGARSTLVPAAADAKTYFGELEFLLDRRTPPTAELRPLVNDALNDLGWRLREVSSVVRREVERALRGGAPCEVCNNTEVVGCPNCDGQGYYVSYGMETECKACRGSGQVVCRACFKGDPWDLERIRERARRRPD